MTPSINISISIGYQHEYEYIRVSMPVSGAACQRGVRRSPGEYLSGKSQRSLQSRRLTLRLTMAQKSSYSMVFSTKKPQIRVLRALG